MADLSGFRPPPEPAHTSVVRHYEDLVAILKHLRESQEEIDRAFDDIASQIGFVFTTTVPVTVEVEKGGKIERIALRGDHFKGTLFEKGLMPILEERLRQLPEGRENRLHSGVYEIYVIWYDALKLKLGAITFRPPPEPAHFHLSQELGGASFRPPPEPAHFSPGGISGILAGNLADRLVGIIFRPPPEPAHWFDRGALISELDQVLIVALDEVYGELKLLERINSFRQLPVQE
jgi:hypothetical protein